MLKDIIDTKTKAKIAALYATQKGPHHVSEVARMLSISKSQASQCLKALEEGGLLKSRTVGRNVIYEISDTLLASSLIESLRHKESLQKKIENTLKKRLEKLRPLSIAIFGSAVTGIKPGSDIDVIVILEKGIDKDGIYKISAALTEEIGIDISIMTMAKEEFIKKAKTGEEFILKVVATHKLIYGREPEEIIWQEKQEKTNQKNS